MLFSFNVILMLSVAQAFVVFELALLGMPKTASDSSEELDSFADHWQDYDSESDIQFEKRQKVINSAKRKIALSWSPLSIDWSGLPIETPSKASTGSAASSSAFAPRFLQATGPSSSESSTSDSPQSPLEPVVPKRIDFDHCAQEPSRSEILTEPASLEQCEVFSFGRPKVVLKHNVKSKKPTFKRRRRKAW